MNALSLFLLSLCASLAVGLALLGLLLVARERTFERRLAEHDTAFRDAVRREAEVSERLQSALRQQARSQQHMSRLQLHYEAREALIRDLGIEPDRLSAGRESLFGNLAIMCMRVGLLLSSVLDVATLRETAKQHDLTAHDVCKELERRLTGRGGAEHDRQARHQVQAMLNADLMRRPLAEKEDMIS